MKTWKAWKNSDPNNIDGDLAILIDQMNLENYNNHYHASRSICLEPAMRCKRLCPNKVRNQQGYDVQTYTRRQRQIRRQRQSRGGRLHKYYKMRNKRRKRKTKHKRRRRRRRKTRRKR